MSTTFAPLRVRGFRRLLATYTINETGDNVGLVALTVLVYDRTGEALPTAALFLASKFLPAFLAPALTARVDQLALRRLLPLLYVLEAAAFVGLAALAGSFWLPGVLALALVDGTVALSARGLTRSAVAHLLSGPELLREGNGLLNVGFAFGVVGGSALGGLLTGAAGVDVALLADAGSFLLAAVLVATIATLPAASTERDPFLRRLRDGLGHVRRAPVTRLLLAGEALALVLFTLIVPIEVIYAKETLGAGDEGYGLLLASWGAGIVLGSLVFLAIKRRSPGPVVLASTAAVGLAYLGLAGVDELWAACALSVLGGLGNGVQWVSVVTLLQETTPLDLQARTVGLLESINAAVPGIGFLLGGAIVTVASPPTAYAVAGAGVMVLVLAGALFGTKIPHLEGSGRMSDTDPPPFGG